MCEVSLNEHTCICDELLPINPGLEEDGGLGWLVGKCGGGNTCGILLPGLELVSIGGLWCVIPFMWDVDGEEEAEPILFLTFKNPCSPLKNKCKSIQFPSFYYLFIVINLLSILSYDLKFEMPTWLIPKKGGGGGGSVEGFDDGNPPAAIGWLFDWRRSKFCKCCWMLCCWLCRACWIAYWKSKE